MTFFDDLGNEISLPKKPKKIISLVPSITETLHDLNLEDYILGITQQCIYPAHFKHTKTIVGNTTNIDIQKIKDLNPEIVFCDKNLNNKGAIEELQKFTQVYVTNITSIEASMRLIDCMGLMLNRRVEAKLINHKIQLKLNDFKTFINSFKIKKAGYFISHSPWMAAGNNTFVNHLLELNKFTNIYANKEDFPVVEVKKIRLEGDPDVVFFSSEFFPFKDKHIFEMGRHTHHASAIYIDGEMFSWFGVRILKAFDYFKTIRERLNNGGSFVEF